MKQIAATFCLVFVLIGCENTPKAPNLGVSGRSNLTTVDSIVEKVKSIVPFVSKEGRFSIIFPDTPIKDLHSTSIEIGEIKLTQFIYTKEETKIWLVSYSDYPQKMIRIGNNSQLLKGIKHRILGEFHARPTLEKKIKLDNKYEGLEFSAHANRNPLDILYKIYLVKNRVYQISMYSSVGKFSPKDSTDFMGSFQLLEVQNPS